MGDLCQIRVQVTEPLIGTLKQDTRDGLIGIERLSLREWGDDRKRIVEKLGVEPADVLELNTVFRERGYRKDMGVKGAVAVLFNRRFIKSRKATTSNWANPRLTEAQLIYAANDAYAALRVFDALGLA